MLLGGKGKVSPTIKSVKPTKVTVSEKKCVRASLDKTRSDEL